MSLLPLARGRRWPTGRMRGLTWSKYDEPENSGFFPPSPLTRGKRVQLENQLRGRGDNHQKIHSFISDRVKYVVRSMFSIKPLLNGFGKVATWSMSVRRPIRSTRRVIGGIRVRSSTFENTPVASSSKSPTDCRHHQLFAAAQRHRPAFACMKNPRTIRPPNNRIASTLKMVPRIANSFFDLLGTGRRVQGSPPKTVPSPPRSVPARVPLWRDRSCQFPSEIATPCNRQYQTGQATQSRRTYSAKTRQCPVRSVSFGALTTVELHPEFHKDFLA